jgi:hypothetical protein
MNSLLRFREWTPLVTKPFNYRGFVFFDNHADAPLSMVVSQKHSRFSSIIQKQIGRRTI